MMDYRVFVVPEACGDLRPEFHENALYMFKTAFGRVVPETEMTAAMKATSANFPHQTL